MKSYTFYGKKSGLQVYCTSTLRKGYQYGRIALRAFPMEEGGKEKRIILMLVPEEAFMLSSRIRGCLSATEGASNLIIHRREKEGAEIVSALHIDRWEKDGKSGWGISISQTRNEDEERTKCHIPVPLSFYGMGYLMRLLEAFAVEQAFEDRVAEPEPEDEIASTSEEIPF